MKPYYILIRGLLTVIFVVLGCQADAQIQRAATRPDIKIADLERMLSQDYTRSANDLQKIGWVPVIFTDSMAGFYYSVGELPGETAHTYYVQIFFKKQGDGTPLVSSMGFTAIDPSVTASFSSEIFSGGYKLKKMEKIDKKSSIQFYDNGKYGLAFGIVQEEDLNTVYYYSLRRLSDEYIRHNSDDSISPRK